LHIDIPKYGDKLRSGNIFKSEKDINFPRNSIRPEASQYRLRKEETRSWCGFAKKHPKLPNRPLFRKLPLKGGGVGTKVTATGDQWGPGRSSQRSVIFTIFSK